MSRATNLAGFVSAIYPSDNLNVGFVTCVGLTVTGVSTFSDLDIQGVTYASVAGIATYAETAGIATVAEGLTGSPDIAVGNITASGDVSIAGTVTYTDVTDVNAIGVITATSGINVTDGGINVVGVVTATSFEGDGTNLVLDYQDLTIRNWMFGPG